MEPQRPPLRLVSERVGLQAVRRCNGSSLSHHPPLPHYALRGRLRQHRDHTTRRLGIPEFQAFEDFNGALGYNMKTSKRQPPATSHTIQGVIISTEPQHITLTPCPQRAQQMCEDFCEEIQLCLNRDQLDPDKARRMAGKCNFLTGRLFGKVGRAPLRAIYASAHSNISQLGKPTRSALHALLNITHHCKPTRLPLQIKHRQFAIIYTDTYHLAGDTKLRPSDDIPEGWRPHRLHHDRERMGSCHVPARRNDTCLGLSREIAATNSPTVQLQHRLHLPVGSLGRHHRTTDLRTPPGPVLHSVLRQRGRSSRPHKRCRETSTLELPD